MKQKPLIIILVLALIVGFIYLVKSANDTQQKMQPEQAALAEKQATAVYKGTLPCADCPGLATTLTLYNDNTYSLEQVYQERDVPPYTESGTWALIKGTATEPDASVYELQPSNTKNNTIGPSYYQVINATTIQMLDNQKAVIDAPFPLNLTKE